MDSKKSVINLNPPFSIKSDGTPIGTEDSDDFGNTVGDVIRISWEVVTSDEGDPLAEIKIILKDVRG